MAPPLKPERFITIWQKAKSVAHAVAWLRRDGHADMTVKRVIGLYRALRRFGVKLKKPARSALPDYVEEAPAWVPSSANLSRLFACDSVPRKRDPNALLVHWPDLEMQGKIVLQYEAWLLSHLRHSDFTD